MKRIATLVAVIAIALTCNVLRAQATDSVDVLDYDIALDLSAAPPFRGDATLTVRKLRACSSMVVDNLVAVDSVAVNGQKVANADLAALPIANIAVGDTFTVRVWYYSYGYVESQGWGGFHFDSDMHYNLGVGFQTNPHVVGRTMFPCRDNFHDKASYTLRVKSKAGWTAECGGIKQSTSTDGDGCEHSVWRISQPTPTYLVSVSQANWQRVQDTIHSLYGDYPATYGYLYPTETQVRNAFADLDTVVPMFERCFGPYRWGRIGYIATEKGSMEHVNNIALARQALTPTAATEEFARTTIVHELGHAWFGNLVTCATEGDMWINEGGASFTSEVGMEAARGREWSDDYYQRNLESVLRTTHVTDVVYRALHGMSHNYTYGSTTYDKGWMVWHSLRGYLGDSLFYASIRQLMDRCAFGNLDADGLRDSLSLYSGVDLTGFFNFHVFSPGFVNYHVSVSQGETPSNVRIAISQGNVGTANLAYANRVPLTFFSATGDTSKVWVCFAGSDTVVSSHQLPFTPAFWVLDYDKEISDAAINGEAHFTSAGTQSLPIAHLTLAAQGPADVYAEHHWGSPEDMPNGVVRSAKRYWVVTGLWNAPVQGKFRYVRTGVSSSSYKNLDRGFYSGTATIDSIYLFHRSHAGEAWRVVSHTRTGSANEGYFVVDSLMAGEYALAVVDTQQLGIGESLLPDFQMQLFPNPLNQGQPLTLKAPTGQPFSVAIVDAEGRQVWRKEECRDGENVRPELPKGIYFVRIENNFISLQSKLIQL